MQSVNHQGEGEPRGDRPALGMIMTLPVAALLWLMIIGAAFELFKWATTA